jgi:hypothetical protein
MINQQDHFRLLLSLYKSLVWTFSLISLKGLLWSWSYGSWIYNYLCNRDLSPLSCESNPVNGEVNSMQHYVIKFLIDLQRVSGFLQELWFPPPIKLIATK